MSPFGEPPQPKSLLDYHRVLSTTAGVRVSPLCLGAMNFGDAWEESMGKCDKKTSFEMLDYFYEQGGNFIDTYVLSTLPQFDVERTPHEPHNFKPAWNFELGFSRGVAPANSSPVQITTRTKSPRLGSESGSPNARTATRLCSPQNSQPASQTRRPRPASA